MKLETLLEMRRLLAAGLDAKIPYHEIRERFERENATKYGLSMPTWVPDYANVHKVFLDAIECNVSDTPAILELGAGTGRVTKLMLERMPKASITAMDNSANMLTAYETFSPELQQQIDVVEADFFSDETGIPSAKFDAVVSVFAVCHGRSLDDYAKLYERIHQWLKPGGVFVCFDHVIPATNTLAELAFIEWADMLPKEWGDAVIHEVITSTITEDFPLPISQHFQLLDTAGFQNLDVPWRKNVFAVYFAQK